jgi:hypothetical protein
VQREVERTVLDHQRACRVILDPARDGVSVLRAPSQNLEDQEVESSLQDAEFVGQSSFPGDAPAARMQPLRLRVKSRAQCSERRATRGIRSELRRRGGDGPSGHQLFATEVDAKVEALETKRAQQNEIARLAEDDDCRR